MRVIRLIPQIKWVSIPLGSAWHNTRVSPVIAWGALRDCLSGYPQPRSLGVFPSGLRCFNKMAGCHCPPAKKISVALIMCVHWLWISPHIFAF